MRERLTGERFVPDEHAHLFTEKELVQLGVREVTPLKEIEGLQGPDFYTQRFTNQVEFIDGWKYNLVHTKIPRERQVTDVAVFTMTPWTIGLNGFLPHQAHTWAKSGDETTIASTPQNLNRASGDYEANSRNYARIPRISAMMLGENERDPDFGIIIGDSRGANYGEGVAAYGPQHGFQSIYNDLRVASQINGVPEMLELQQMCRGMSPEQIAAAIRNGEIPAHLNPIRVSKLLFRTVKRLGTTFGPEFTPLLDLVRDPIKMAANGDSLDEIVEHTTNKFRLESLDLPLTAIRHYPSSLDISPRGAYRQMMEFIPLTDGSYGWTVRNVLRKSQFQYLAGRKRDGLSVFEDVEAAHDPKEFPHTITNSVDGTHKDILRQSDHTDRTRRIGEVIIPILANYGEKLKAMDPDERSGYAHQRAAEEMPEVFKGTTSDVPEDYGTAA